MPDVRGYHHLTLTVTDVERSKAWWTQVFGFEVFRESERDGMTRVVLRHPAGFTFSLTGHGARASGDAFSEFRTGMDHIAFAVPGRSELQAWEAWFSERGVTYSVSGEDLVSFRDPDNIAFELYVDSL